jgi:diphosphomevalonate decarboxylase
MSGKHQLIERLDTHGKLIIERHIHKMSTLIATGVAHPNIAFIKYWGNIDSELNIPSTGSISMNLDALWSKTTVTFEEKLKEDTLTINGNPASLLALQRVSTFLNIVRTMANRQIFADVRSVNNFPIAAGLASSASAFAALSLAATRALGLTLSEIELSRLARRGSGSSCRSVPPGYVEWQLGRGNGDSYAHSIAPAQHWLLTDCIAIVQSSEKLIGSQTGHLLAATSPFQPARILDAPRRLAICRQAILQRDFDALAKIIELDSNMLHAVMITSDPPLVYWQPSTLAILKIIPDMRAQGWPVCYTIDAGANIHIICPADYSAKIERILSQIPTVSQVLISPPGGGVSINED